PQNAPVRQLPFVVGGLRVPPLPRLVPTPNQILPIDPKRTDSQDALTDADSVEQRKNECGPASVANSIEYLKVNDGLKNVQGTGQAKDKSRVDWLDIVMGFTNMGTPSGGILGGKLLYINGNNPTGKPLGITVHRQGRFCPANSVEGPDCPGGVNGDAGK